MKTLIKLDFIFNKKQKKQLVILAFMILLGAGLELMGVTAILPFINVAMDPASIYKSDILLAIYNFLNCVSVNVFLAILALVLVGIYILKNAFLVLLNYCIFRFTYDNQREMAYRLLDGYLKQPYTFFVQNNSADLIRNINTDTGMLFDTVLSTLSLFVECIVCGCLFVYLLITDKSITIGIGLLMTIFLFVFIRFFKKSMKERGEMERISRARMNKWLLETFGGIKETKIMEREGFFLGKVDEEYKNYADNHCVYQTASYMPKPIVETLCMCGVLLVVALKLLRGVDSEYFISTLSVFAVAALRLLPAFNKITGYLSRIMFNKSGVDAVYEDLLQVKELEKNIVKESDTVPLFFEKEIKIDNISFKYPNTDENVLTDVTVTIPKNKSVAFIGPSGAGKTTLVDILLGILHMQKGRILVDGVDIKQNMKAWHHKIGYIPQTIYLLDDTIENNIAYGEDSIDEERLAKAIEEAQLSQFVNSLEHGVKTQIGERGVRLSGGQRQRIGIARALYSNPDILVLDEATSALDNDTETAVMEAINNLAGKKTLIIIAHRLTTIENCDYKYEVKNQKLMKAEVVL